jgi:small basic protein (TIGR04137 family)
MSQHPSLRSDSVGAKHRNVFKRFERVKKLQDMGKWSDRNTAYNLPKVKSLKVKIKKVKEAKEGAAEGAVAPVAGKTPAKPAGDSKKG